MMTVKKILILLLVPFLLLTSCKEELLPKPKAQLRLEYPEAGYSLTETHCPFVFERSREAEIHINDKCWANIEYKTLRASINMTYRPVEDNLEELLLEAEKLTFNHTIKADAISSRPYANDAKKVYGAIFDVTGNAASPIQFHATDSSRHFITGAVYFEVQPNYDSIKPAIHYLQKDVVRLMESIEWKYATEQ